MIPRGKEKGVEHKETKNDPNSLYEIEKFRFFRQEIVYDGIFVFLAQKQDRCSYLGHCFYRSADIVLCSLSMMSFCATSSGANLTVVRDL